MIKESTGTMHGFVEVRLSECRCELECVVDHISVCG